MMFLLAFVLLIAFVLMLWYFEGKAAGKFCMGKNAGVKLIGPMYSISASGTIGNAFTFLTWKGIQYAREYFIPANPNTAKMQAIRGALRLCVAYWKLHSDPKKAEWKVLASGKKYTGMNYMIHKGLLAYMVQLGTGIIPVSVTYVDDPGVETWTWVGP